MNEQRKVWLGLGAALIAGSAMAENHSGEHDAVNSHSSHSAMQAAAATGGGEAEGAVDIDLTTNDAAFLGQLGLVRGHLWVGVQLYKHGHKDMALTHMKHPGDELYAGLLPALEARDNDGFAEELSALANAVENGESEETVEQRHRELEEAVATAENAADDSLKTALLGIERMVRVAAEEYAIGVKNGEIVNAHEYQDAMGFVEIARIRLANLTDAQRAEGPGIVDEVSAQLELVRPLWPMLVPEGNIDGDASTLYGAAARIQLAAWDLD